MPRYVGPTAGQWERWDFNAHLNGRAPITPQLNPGTTSFGGFNSNGRLSTACIPNPAAPTVVQFGATGSATLSYFVVCHDSNAGETSPSSATTIINGNSSLSSSNFVLVSWSAVPGCSSWDVLKGNTSTALATGVTGLFVNDTGQATSPYAPALRNSTCDVAGNPLAGASPAIQGFSVNGMNNLAAQAGARPSVNTTTANTTAGSLIATVNAISDFAVGDTVDIRHGGAASTLATPTSLTVAPLTYDASHSPTASGCTVDPSNSGCSTSWTFRWVWTDGKGGTSAPSSAVTITNGPANPGVANPIDIQVAGSANAKGARIYGCSGASCTPVLIAAIPNIWFAGNWSGSFTIPMQTCNGCSSPANGEYLYIGHNFGSDNVDGTTLPAAAENDDLYAAITAINGSNITLSSAPQASGSFLMLHDDAPELQALVDAAPQCCATGSNSSGLDLYVPPGVWNVCENVSLYGKAAVRLHGAGASGGADVSTQIQWCGGAGDPVFNLNQTRDNVIELFGVTDAVSKGSTPGFVFDVDKYDAGQGFPFNTTHNVFRDLVIGRAGVPVSFSNRGSTNDENNVVENVDIDAGPSGQGHWACFYIGGSAQTNQEVFAYDNIDTCDIGFFGNRPGSIQSIANNYSQLGTIYWIGSFISGNGITDIGSTAQADGRLLYAPRFSNFYQPIQISQMSFETFDPVQNEPLQTLPGDLAFLIDFESFGLRLEGSQFLRETNGVVNYTAPMKAVLSSGTSSQPAPLLSIGNSYSDPNWYTPQPTAGQTNGLLSVYDNTFTSSGQYIMANYINNPCAGAIALSSGAGAFTNSCITANSHCTANDQTAANPVKVAAPSAGSVSLAGTGSDTIMVVCQ